MASAPIHAAAFSFRTEDGLRKITLELPLDDRSLGMRMTDKPADFRAAAADMGSVREFATMSGGMSAYVSVFDAAMRHPQSESLESLEARAFRMPDLEMRGFWSGPEGLAAFRREMPSHERIERLAQDVRDEGLPIELVSHLAGMSLRLVTEDPRMKGVNLDLVRLRDEGASTIVTVTDIGADLMGLDGPERREHGEGGRLPAVQEFCHLAAQAVDAARSRGGREAGGPEDPLALMSAGSIMPAVLERRFCEGVEGFARAMAQSEKKHLRGERAGNLDVMLASEGRAIPFQDLDLSPSSRSIYNGVEAFRNALGRRGIASMADLFAVNPETDRGEGRARVFNGVLDAYEDFRSSPAGDEGGANMRRDLTEKLFRLTIASTARLVHAEVADGNLRGEAHRLMRPKAAYWASVDLSAQAERILHEPLRLVKTSPAMTRD